MQNKKYAIPTISDKGVKCTSSAALGAARSHIKQNGVNYENLVNIKIEKGNYQVKDTKLKLSLVNTQSVCGPEGKTQDFIDYVIGLRSDLCIVTETFLTERNNVTRAALHPEGYSFKDQPRLNGSARGGTGIFHKDCFIVEKTDAGQKESFEFSEWNVSWLNNLLKVCIVYHRPYSVSNPVTNSTFISEIKDYFETVALSNGKLLIAGDFNLHVEDLSDCYGKQLNEVLSSFGLINHVTVPTHISGHTLDLIISRNTDELEITPPRAGYFISDHCFISAFLDVPKPNLQVKTINCRKIKSISLPEFRSDLVDICTELDEIQDIDQLASQYNAKLSGLLDKHAPSITKTLLVRPKVPWYNDFIKELKKDRRKAENNWRKCKSDECKRGEFQSARNKCRSELSNSQTRHYSDSISKAAGDQKKLYSIIASLTTIRKGTPFPPHNSIQELANDFGNFFVQKIEKIRSEIDAQNIPSADIPYSFTGDYLSSFEPLSEEQVKKFIMDSKTTTCDSDPIPTHLVKENLDILLPIITKMVNLSLQSGVFPEEWKLALIIPLIKKLGLELIFKSYRPVSNLQFVSKVVERAVLQQNSDHMKSSCPLPVCSSAYREGHSTESALLKVQSDILRNMELQQVTLLVLIDLSAAFDTVDYSIALSVLERKFGITGVALTFKLPCGVHWTPQHFQRALRKLLSEFQNPCSI